MAIIAVVPVVLAVIAKYPEVPAGFALSDAIGLLKEPAVLVAALALFCYISLESSFCNWLPPYSKEVISKDFSNLDGAVVDATSQQMLSAFAVAMMAGRLISSQIGNITAYGGFYIAGAALIAALIILAMGRSGAIWTSALAACAGFFFAPCFPTIVGVMYAKHPENFGSVFGIIFAVGLFGGVIIPKTIGNMAKGSSIQKSLKLLVPICLALIVLALILGRLKGA
jgi:fucose permease